MPKQPYTILSHFASGGLTPTVKSTCPDCKISVFALPHFGTVEPSLMSSTLGNAP
jgi:hypothetical protein